MKVAYSSQFLRQYKKLSKDDKLAVKERISLFEKNPRDPKLETHKLHGKLAGRYGFSWGFKNRITFLPLSKNEVALLSVGDHDIYQ